MNRFKKWDIYSKLVFLLILVLFIPAFFGNIGIMPFRTDEPTRLNVAIEMFLSGNYITPKINGEFYYNKPPLYNWILIATNQISKGFFSEFYMRIPTVIFLMLFAFVIWRFTYQRIGNHAAIAAALGFITGGRILFWDSYQALIDIPFSLIIFLNFFILIKIPDSKKPLLFLSFSYLLIGLAFLFKGFPAIVFQALSLPAVLFAKKKGKLLFSWKHLAGSIPFFVVVGLYFWAYALYNDVETLTNTLFDQSANRTAVSDSITIKDTIIHLFTFPFEMIYHFLPWSFIILLFFSKASWKLIKSNSFLFSILLLFIINIPIYWISVDVKPRYLFMFSPLLLIVGLSLFYHPSHHENRIVYYLKIVFKSIAWFGMVISIILPSVFSGQWNYINLLIGLLAAITCFAFVYSMLKNPQLIIFSLIGILFVYRILFNFFELPSRHEKSNDVLFKDHAIAAAQLTKNQEVYIWTDCTVNHEFTFYFTREKKQILKRWYQNMELGKYYILDKYKWDYSKTFTDQKIILIKTSPSRMGDVFLVKRIK